MFEFYPILDEKYIREDLTSMVEQLCQAGVKIIQLREKNSSTKKFIADAIIIRDITKKFNTKFIINDRVDIAFVVDADGVHLGQEDMPVPYAKKILKNKIIGKSVSSVYEAIEAEKEGCSYIGLSGSIYQSKTKKDAQPISLDVVREIKNSIKIPVVCIGGITLDKLEELFSIPIDGVCVGYDLFSYKNVGDRAKQYLSKIAKIKRYFS